MPKVINDMKHMKHTEIEIERKNRERETERETNIRLKWT